MPEAFRLVAALLPLGNIIVIYNSCNPQISAPDTRVVGNSVTVRPGITNTPINWKDDVCGTFKETHNWFSY